MNKTELVAEIAKNTGLTKVDSERAVEAFLNAVSATLKKGDEVILLDGIHGKIVSIKGTLVELKISQNTIVYVEKESIMGKSRELLFK